MRLWVFRTAGSPGGDPDKVCPTTLNQSALYTGNIGEQCRITDYDGCVDFILNDMVKNLRLRQGWGVPTLDLRLPEAVWIENYIVASNRYWGKVSDCGHASGRRNIINVLTEMEQGDVIFLPNIIGSKRDERYFSVCHVKGQYFFEDRSYLKDNWEKDFGHVIPIHNISSYEYGSSTLERLIFGPPYMHAIDEVKKHFKSYNVLFEFAQNMT